MNETRHYLETRPQVYRKIRCLLEISIWRLASICGVSETMVRDFEKGMTSRSDTLTLIFTLRELAMEDEAVRLTWNELVENPYLSRTSMSTASLS